MIPEPMIDFVIIGAMKAGTTTLHKYLKQSREVNMCKLKEPRFFSLPGEFSGTWDKGLDWYASLFDARRGLRGEASTCYTKLPISSGVAERLFTVNPKLKIIYLVRNPIDRAISHYLHKVRFNYEGQFIHEALGASDSIYIQCSKYFMQLSEYLRFFSPEQILVMPSESLWSSPETYLPILHGFLGIENLMSHPLLRAANCTSDKLKNSLLSTAENPAQKQLWLAVSGDSLSKVVKARDIGERLGFGSVDRLRLARVLESDTDSLFRWLGYQIPQWEKSEV